MPIENFYLGTFLAMSIFSLGLGTLGAGLFTAYFGAGKSRTIGFTLSLVGIVVLLLFAAFTWPIVGSIEPIFFAQDVQIGLVGLVGAVVGGIVALIVFLVSIMRA